MFVHSVWKIRLRILPQPVNQNSECFAIYESEKMISFFAKHDTEALNLAGSI